MCALLYDHGIWSDLTNWKECIEYVVKVKIDDSNRRRKAKELRDKQNGVSSGNSFMNKGNGWGGQKDETKDKNIFKKGFRSLKNIMPKTKEEKVKIELKANANVIFNELNRFVQYFINMQMPID